ncbi:MAG: MGMT family protein [Janthinobacterium lividum]
MKPTPTQREFQQAKRSLFREGARPNQLRDEAFRRVILSVPPGKVSTYGAVAAAAGYPRLHRAVARLLRTDPADRLPWHRIVGAAGDIRLRESGTVEQRARLELEGVRFRGKHVDLALHLHTLKPWEE